MKKKTREKKPPDIFYWPKGDRKCLHLDLKADKKFGGLVCAKCGEGILPLTPKLNPT